MTFLVYHMFITINVLSLLVEGLKLKHYHIFISILFNEILFDEH